jgi:hypothetical protein
MPTESVKQILMRRDNLSSSEADEVIENFIADFNALLDDDNLSLLDAEELVRYHFGLEPDYLMEFI